MRFLCASDFHGNYEWIDKLIQIFKEKNTDCVLYCGDFGLRDYADIFLKEMNRNKIKTLAIPGNMDFGYEFESEFAECTSYGIRKLENFLFLLIGANYPFMIDSVLSDLSSFEWKKSNVVILTHYPPLGILDEVNGEHVGYEGYKVLDEKIKPVLHCFGHIHEAFGHKKLDGTTFINCAAAIGKKVYIFDSKTKEVEEIKL